MEDHTTFELSLIRDGHVTKRCAFVVNEKLSPHAYTAAFNDLAWQARSELLYESSPFAADVTA